MRDADPGPSLARLGEFPTIARMTAGRRQPSTTLLGPGDDAAVVAAPDGRTVVSTDMLVEGRHFRLDWSGLRDVGRKAIAQNAADIEAMGARCTAFVVALGAPGAAPAAWAQDLADGLWTEAGCLDAGVVGGDLVDCDRWVVAVTALGDLAGAGPVLRSGARAGSVLAVCGDLGRSAAGYALWANGVEGSHGGFDALRRRHLVPEPPYGHGAAAASAGAAAMTDISDGLIADARSIADSSSVGIELNTAALQRDHDAVRDAARAVDGDPWEWVLSGGEDHALLAAFPDAPPTGWRVIGRVAPGPARVTVDGRDWPGQPGWQSFGGGP